MYGERAMPAEPEPISPGEYEVTGYQWQVHDGWWIHTDNDGVERYWQPDQIDDNLSEEYNEPESYDIGDDLDPWVKAEGPSAPAEIPAQEPEPAAPGKGKNTRQ